MANSNESGCGTLIAVAAIAFFIGRASVGDSDVAPAITSPSPPQYLAEPQADIESLSAYSEAQDSPEPVEDAFTYFPNCSAARAAGAAPVREGDPGYASHLDRDNDGVGCE